MLSIRSAFDPKLTALPSWTASSCPCTAGANWQGVTCNSNGYVSNL